MNIAKALYEAAVSQAIERYPSGWSGAAAIRTESGKILTSVAPEIKNRSLSLCMEVGAYLEANRINEAVTHSLCLYRENEHSEFIILSPCGICQERLSQWGGNVQVAITNSNNDLIFKSLRELMPHNWLTAFEGLA